MVVEEAVRKLHKEFPFPGYTNGEAGEQDAYKNIPQTVQRHLRSGGRILDFGSGPCDKTAVLQYLGYQCSAFDDLGDDWHSVPGNREKILAFAKECGIDFHLATGAPFSFEKESFDMVMLHDVLEHLHDSPRDLLSDLLEFVVPEGFLFVTVPNAVNVRKRIAVALGKTNYTSFDAYYWSPGEWRGHIREYVRDDLVKLSQYLGLDTVELRSCDHMSRVLPAAVRPVYRLITSVFRGWKDTWLLVARKKPGWVPRKELPRDELDRIIERSTSYRYEA